MLQLGGKWAIYPAFIAGTNSGDSGEAKPVTSDDTGPEADKNVILLVEDEPDILAYGKSALEKAGYRVLSAMNADVALVMLSSGLMVDLLITDIMMPGALDGFGLARRVRDLDPGIPIIYCTGYSGAAAVRSKGAPSGQIIQKPWRAHELVDLVNATLHPIKS